MADPTYFESIEDERNHVVAESSSASLAVQTTLQTMGASLWSCDAKLSKGGLASPAPEVLAEFAQGRLNWFEGVFPSDVALVRQFLESAASGLKVAPLDYRIVSEASGIVWVRHWITKIGKAPKSGLEGTVQVVQEQKRLEGECIRAGEREQTAIGQELHDDICQLLAGVSCMLRVVEHTVKTTVPGVVGLLGELAQQVDAGMLRTRSLAHGLVPFNSLNKNIDLVLRELAGEAELRFSIKVSLKTSKAVPLHNSEQALHVYRIAQESITNSIRHGKATRVDLSLLCSKGENMTLKVTDNGSGIPDEASRTQGLGLQIMAYRAKSIAGELSISGQSKGGTIVTLKYIVQKEVGSK